MKVKKKSKRAEAKSWLGCESETNKAVGQFGDGKRRVKENGARLGSCVGLVMNGSAVIAQSASQQWLRVHCRSGQGRIVDGRWCV